MNIFDITKIKVASVVYTITGAFQNIRRKFRVAFTFPKQWRIPEVDAMVNAPKHSAARAEAASTILNQNADLNDASDIAVTMSVVSFFLAICLVLALIF